MWTLARTAFVRDEEFKAADRDLASTSLSRTYGGATAPSDIEKLGLSSSQCPRVERREWWTCVEEVALTAAQEDQPIRIALARVGGFFARAIRFLFRAVRGFSDRNAAPASLDPIEESGSPGETAEPSLASSDDPRDLIE